MFIYLFVHLFIYSTLFYAILHASIKAELSLQAEAFALDMKDLWRQLKPMENINSNRNSYGRAPSISDWNINRTHVNVANKNNINVSKMKYDVKIVESCQLFLAKLTRACAIYIGWTDELEENCEALNDEITRDKESYRDYAGLRLGKEKNILLVFSYFTNIFIFY